MNVFIGDSCDSKIKPEKCKNGCKCCANGKNFDFQNIFQKLKFQNGCHAGAIQIELMCHWCDIGDTPDPSFISEIIKRFSY